MNQIYEISNICYAYDDGTSALNGLSISLDRFERLGLVGANGSGKSTLLFHLIGCLSPDSGELRYKGRPFAGDRAAVNRLRRETGFLFQDPQDQLFLTTVGEDVAFGPRNQGRSEGEISRNVDRALEAIGISAIRDRSPWKLSGGERTLAALAGLLACEPEALLLDEPTSGLDPVARENLIAILKSLPCAMVIATHDLDMVLEVCDRVAILSAGRVVGESSVPGLLADEEFLVSCGMRLPLTLCSGTKR